MSKKISLVKGTRDFGPETMFRRKYILNTIEKVFKNYGFLQIETPALEQLDTLSGKYGTEGDKLLFKILNSGDFMAGIDPNLVSENNISGIAQHISEKGLRYDLTVPLARFVVMNKHSLTFPFKRYQIQPVWRADRPQKGRYREFWQCDADIIGSDSLLHEADLLNILLNVFETLGVQITILINNRKILEAMAEKFIDSTHSGTFMVLIDKLDKIDFDSLIPEFLSIGLKSENTAALKNLLIQHDFSLASIHSINELLVGTKTIEKGCKELEQVLNFISTNNSVNPIKIDLSLARGLDYYTGCIIEVKASGVKMGSISGGGRYDNLTGVFGLPNVSGVGISFGIDRIFDVMEELQLFDEIPSEAVDVLFCHFDEQGLIYNQKIAGTIRKKGIRCEVYSDIKKLAKQFEYADKKGIPLVFISGETEIKNQQISYKNLKNKEQGILDLNNIEDFLINK